MTYELTPAYGRDYKNKAEVTAAFEAGKDFVGDYQMRFQLCNKADIATGSKVILRYRKNTSLVVITVK